MGTGINGAEFMVLLLIAIVLIGPEKLPELAQQLGRLTRELKALATGARARVREELGPEFDDMDLSVLDPRQYDPRRIVREALMDDEPPARGAGNRGGTGRPRADRRERPAITPVSAAPTAAAAPPSMAAPTVAGPSSVVLAAGAGAAGAVAAGGVAAQPQSTPAEGQTPAVPAQQPPAAPAQAAAAHGSHAVAAPEAASGPAVSPASAAPAPEARPMPTAVGRPIQSPRDIVARTRGVVPAAESPVVAAALGGMAADAAAERSAGDPVSTPATVTPNAEPESPRPAAPATDAGQAAPRSDTAPGAPTSGGANPADTYVVPFDDEAT